MSTSARFVTRLVLFGLLFVPPQSRSAGEVETIEIPGTAVSFEMVWLPAGAFRMGSAADEVGRDDDEGPLHEVSVEAFWIGRREVTHDEYEVFRFRSLDAAIGAEGAPFDLDAISRPSPPYEDPAHGLGKSGHPATGMTRRAALHYARWLSSKTGRLFRLPTEAEWEYACRAGTATAFSFGDVADGLAEHGWTERNANDGYRPVGLLEPNPWGLFDLHGNVAEWVMDSYRADAYSERAGAPADAPMVGSPPLGRGVVRGGSYQDAAAEARCASRLPEDARWKRRDPQVPKSRWWNTDSPHVGFRLVSPARALGADEIDAFWRDLFGESE